MGMTDGISIRKFLQLQSVGANAYAHVSYLHSTSPGYLPAVWVWRVSECIELGGTQKVGGAQHHFAAAGMGAEMDGVQYVHIIELPALCHGLATVIAFFCGLEQQFDVATKPVWLVNRPVSAA